MTLYALLLSVLGLFPPQDHSFEYYVEGFARNVVLHPDSAVHYAGLMLDEAHRQEDVMLIIRAEYALGYIHRYLDNYVEAAKHYHISWQLSKSNGFAEREVMASNGLGLALYMAGDYPEALRFLYMSLAQRMDRNIPAELGTVYNNIGLVYMKMYNWEKAHEFFSRALIEQQEQDASILVNMGICLPKLQRFAEAQTAFANAREWCATSDCPPELWCDYYNAYGGYFLEMKEHESARIYFHKALEYARENGLVAHQEKAYDNIALVELRLGNKGAAKSFADSALTMAIGLQVPVRIKNNFYQLALIHQAMGDHEIALDFWNKYDSAGRDDQENKVLNEIFSLALNQQEQLFDDHIQAQQGVLINSQRNVYLFAVLAVIFAVMAGMWWYNLRKKNKAMNELAAMHQAFARKQKMAALGSLMAGIAHEINTPLATAQAVLHNSTDHLAALTGEWREDLPALYSELYDTYSHGMNNLLGLERRRARKSIEHALAEENISEPGRWSELFIECGIHTPDPRAVTLLKQGGESWIEKLYSATLINRNHRHALESVERIRHVMTSLRDHALEPDKYLNEQFGLVENINGVLVLLQNQLKYDVLLETDFPEDELMITGQPHRLGQVWTNLIVNALQAMYTNEKCLKVAINAAINGFVRVRIGDSGHGISAEDQAHVFENQYSTRYQEAGSGLGLYLARTIVSEHHGYICFISGEGFTEMNVFLPQQTYGKL